MRLWNIGAEGQFLLGAWGASAVVLVPILPAGTPAHRGHPGDDGGRRRSPARLWGFIPGVLKARFGVNEIIATLMLNYIALVLDPVLGLRAVERGRLPDDRRSSRARPGCRASPTSAGSFPALGGLTVHLGFLFAHRRRGRSSGSSLERSRWGYEIRLIGDNPRAARYAGIDIARNIILVFVVSGGAGRARRA